MDANFLLFSQPFTIHYTFLMARPPPPPPVQPPAVLKMHKAQTSI